MSTWSDNNSLLKFREKGEKGDLYKRKVLSFNKAEYEMTNATFVVAKKAEEDLRPLQSLISFYVNHYSNKVAVCIDDRKAEMFYGSSYYEKRSKLRYEFNFKLSYKENIDNASNFIKDTYIKVYMKDANASASELSQEENKAYTKMKRLSSDNYLKAFYNRDNSVSGYSKDKEGTYAYDAHKEYLDSLKVGDQIEYSTKSGYLDTGTIERIKRTGTLEVKTSRGTTVTVDKDKIFFNQNNF